MIDYVSKYSNRKDYFENIRRYETDLLIPYYLTIDVERREMTLFRLRAKSGYGEFKPKGDGRLKLPELELELGMLKGWLRLWFRSELIPLPCELLDQLNTEKQRADALEARLKELERAKKNGGY